MLWDLGMRPNKDLEDVHKVQKKIQALQTEFDLVMIAERMDESLVLLADLMCWSLDDVAYITQNKRFGIRDRHSLKKNVGNTSKCCFQNEQSGTPLCRSLQIEDKPQP